MMLQQLWKPALWLLAATLALAWSARSLPQDSADFEPFLRSGGVFLDIQPGRTRLHEAIRLLENTGWVLEREKDLSGWTWNGSQPTYLDTDVRGFATFQGDIVQRVRLQSTVTLGDAWSVLGTPEWAIIGTGRTSNLYITLGYPEDGLHVFVALPECGLPPHHNLRTEVAVIFTHEQPPYIDRYRPALPEIMSC